VPETQPEQWKNPQTLSYSNSERKFLERIASQLKKADPNAAGKELRALGA